MKAIRVLRWWIAGLVMAGAMLNYLTRAVMGVATGEARPADFDWFDYRERAYVRDIKRE